MSSFLREFSRWHVEKHLLPIAAPTDSVDLRLTRVGDALLPLAMVRPEWICYCGGVGEDIRIERHLAEECGARVWAFDPTPRSRQFMETADYDRARLCFMPVGLWSHDAVLRFHAPANPLHVSHSVMEELGGATFFDAHCRSVSAIMESLGHERIDLIKLNIEGAEDVVLGAALEAGVRPRVIALTFEGRKALLKAREWRMHLRAHGYQQVARLDWFFTFVRRPAAA